jgi:inositol hexakisphosphate
MHAMTTFLALLAFASPVVAQYCPVAVGPGCDRIWLVENGAPSQGEGQDPTLPTHFRHLPEVGLRSLGESGSAQPTATGYGQIASWLRKTYPQVRTVAVFDLRQESHGYVAGTPLSWYFGRDQVNCGKSELGMAQDESERLAALGTLTAVELFGRTTPPTDAACKTGIAPRTIPARLIQSEAEVVEALGSSWRYYRLHIADFHAPSDDTVDFFVGVLKTLPEKSWLHFHCAAGDGRTTILMAMAEMMRSARTTDMERIIAGQRQLGHGAIDLGEYCNIPKWKSDWARDRLWFLRLFYQYAKEQSPGFELAFSKWKAKNSDLVKDLRPLECAAGALPAALAATSPDCDDCPNPRR